MSDNPSREPQSLLVVRLGAMGDIVHALHAVSALRNALPVTRIGWIVEERWVELLCAKDSPRSGPRDAGRPLVDVVHAVNTKSWRKALLSLQTRREIAAAFRTIRRQGYDMAVDFQGALKSAVFARWAGASQVLGMQNPREAPARWFYRQRVPIAAGHVVEQYRALAEAIAGRPLQQPAVEFPEDHRSEAMIAEKLVQARGDFVLISPGAGWGAKQWPPRRYGEVARALARDGLRPLVNFGPTENELAAEVAAASGSSAVRVECSISELIALTRRARLFIGGDTGPLHLAAALHVPVVAIFGPTDPARNGPYGTRSVVLRHPSSRTSLSHTSAADPGLLQITSEEVVAAARRLLGVSYG